MGLLQVGKSRPVLAKMIVLIVARCKNGRYAPFITEQVTALERKGVTCQYFGINDKGLFGYLKHFHRFRLAIHAFRPDVIHAHYGFSGLFANLQRRIPVVTTYHGSDINDPRMLFFSRWAIRLSAYNVFVSKENLKLANPTKDNYSIIPCGINLEDYPLLDQNAARQVLGWNDNRHYILFSGAFDNPVKNAALAQSAMELLDQTTLVELKGYSRSQVSLLMNASDALVMTSHTEGSPQVIKEAMACGCPIVSVDVGDVKEITDGIDGCYISERTPESVASCLRQAIEFGKKTEGRKVIETLGLTNDIVAKKLLGIYNSVI